MKELLVIVSALALYGVSLTTQAQSTNAEILALAEGVCKNEIGGSISRTTIAGNINGNIAGVAKVLGLTLGADGKLYKEDAVYVGIPIEKLSPVIQTPAECRKDVFKMLIDERHQLAMRKKVSYKTCRHPDFGQVGWIRSEDHTNSSGWQGGGGDQNQWCQAVIASFLTSRSVGPRHAVARLGSSEESKKDWKGHVEYKYHCSIRVQWEPLYAEKSDPRCGVIEN